MSSADDVAKYLATLVPLGLVFATNLFVGKEPKSPANCVTLYDTGGPTPKQDYSGSLFISVPSVQIRVRNTAFLTGDILINDIRTVVKQIVDTTLSGTRYEGAFIRSDVIHLGLKSQTNEGIAHVWTLNIDLIKED